jgi:hypothetical protein
MGDLGPNSALGVDGLTLDRLQTGPEISRDLAFARDKSWCNCRLVSQRCTMTHYTFAAQGLLSLPMGYEGDRPPGSQGQVSPRSLVDGPSAVRLGEFETGPRVSYPS